MLREFNGATKHQMDQQIAATDAAVQHLTSIRQDLDHAYAGIRSARVSARLSICAVCDV
jgi:chromosome condensin MukBEF ATPase and DNA-binding subunit MukB